MRRSDWETLFWTVFAESGTAMAVVDADRLLVSANGPLQRLLGRTAEDLAGKPIDGCLAPADRGPVAERWQAMLARGESHGVEELTGARGGRLRVSYAAHVAHVAGRLVALVVLMPEGAADGLEPGAPEPPAPLTPRELEIVARVAMGATSREIADELHVTTETVRTHVRNAMAKTGTRTRAHLVAAAICRGFLPAISPS